MELCTSKGSLNLILSNMGDICKIWEKDGCLFATHSFINSNSDKIILRSNYVLECLIFFHILNFCVSFSNFGSKSMGICKKSSQNGKTFFSLANFKLLHSEIYILQNWLVNSKWKCSKKKSNVTKKWIWVNWRVKCLWPLETTSVHSRL